MPKDKATTSVTDANGKDGEQKPESSSATPLISYLAIFQYAEPLDILLMVLGTLGGVGNGACWPAFAIMFGKFTDTFGQDSTMQDFKDRVADLSIQFIVIALISFACSYLQTSCWMWAGNRQTNRIRGLYLRAVLRQDVAYFDTNISSGGLMTGLSEDSVTIQQGISEKVGNFLQHTFTFLCGFGVAFYRGWDLALVMVGCLPFLAVIGAAVTKLSSNYAARASKAYQEAGATVNETIGQIRTVQAYHQQDRHVEEYDEALETPFVVGKKQSMVAGLALGGVNAIVYFSYGLALFYGAWRVAHKRFGSYYSGGDVLAIVIAALIGGFALGQGAPNITSFTKARGAAARVFEVIARKPDIDIEEEGEQLPEVKGEIELKGVKFAYPARPDVQIFSDFSLVVPAGKTVALVGSSGSGKSTVVQLIERFYDPLQGIVLLDGVDIRKLQLSWLRSQVGLVSQEPTLFATTIFENIAMGKPGATMAEVEAAAKDANAHLFISKLPLGYDTNVGERGLQLSGGQKQRIAIARAILKNPKVLLLDEATSALDTKSERIVQQALDRVVVGRTTVVVAHRLSTIQGADIIAVLQDGRLVEQGSHQELLQRPDGAYTALVTIQMQAAKQQVQEAKQADVAVVEEGVEGEDDDEVIHIDQDGLQHARSGGLAPQSSLKERKASGALELLGLGGRKASEQLPDVEQGKEATKATTKDKEGKEEKEVVKVPMSRLLAYNKSESAYTVAGVLASALVGATQPAVAYTLSEVLRIYYEPDKSKIVNKAILYCCLMAIIGVVCLVAGTIMQYCFGVLGAHLSRRLRRLLLANILRQEVAFFDDPKYSSAALAVRLSEDTTYIRGAVGDTLSLICQNLTCLAVGYIIALRFDWRMALVVTGLLPLVVSAMTIYFKFMTGASSAADSLYASANQTVTDAFRAIRTIHAYNLRDSVCALYGSLLAPAHKTMFKNAQLTGLSMGYSNFVVFGIYSFIIWFGGEEVSSGRATFDEMFKAFMAVMLAAQGLSQAQTGFPDMGKAKDAVQRLFPILDRKSAIDSGDPSGETPQECKGAISLRNVSFVYPQRPEVVVLNNFSLDIQVGKVVALVGESGCGKSTIIGLMERFYDPVQGIVLLDGVDIRKYQVKWLRAQMALVSQEPLLFSSSILENIRYGHPTATMEQVINAAKAANAHAFIDELPEKYNTQVGEGGVQLSGGQKQRVAIARAVIKEPRILLLDEATSALDASAEKLVQSALDSIMVGRTSVVVAHRLSTIRHADCITFMHQGAILEQGTHEELMAKSDGGYARLVAAQMAHSPASSPSPSQGDLTKQT